MIEYACPKCETPLTSPESLAGQSDRCPRCGNSVEVPVLLQSDAGRAVVVAWPSPRFLLAGRVRRAFGLVAKYAKPAMFCGLGLWLAAVLWLLLSINGRLGELNRATAGITADVSSVEGNLSSVEGDVSSMRRDVSSLETSVSSIESDVSTLQSDVSSIEGDVSDIQIQGVSIRR